MIGLFCFVLAVLASPFKSGEKAGLVTFGVMRLWLEEEPHLLGEGDSFRFSSQISHRFDNPTREPAGVLWIVSTR
jgi:quercetin dioxygenase-like cupin family protein